MQRVASDRPLERGLVYRQIVPFGDRWELRNRSAATRLVVTLPVPITSLAGSMAHTRPRIVATLERGVARVDLVGGVCVEIVANERQFPVATLTLGGRLVVADARERQVYGAQRGQLCLLDSAPIHQGKPVAVVPTDHVDRFALCDSEGHISVREFVTAK